MSASKLPQLKEKQRQNTKKLCLQNVDQLRSKHEDERIVAGRSALKRSLGSKEKHVNNVPKAKKKNFVIPRKNNQAKELLQSQHFDSREVKDLLRHVKLSFRHQSSSSTFKFEKAEFVNNEKLSQKYAEKKQELRLELPKNRELEEKFAFLYTQSRTKAKTICEHGLQTGHCQLNFLGDPKLGIYLCRYADIVYKRTLDVQDSGYLIVFNMIKGRVKGISGGNPEQQPTPHHDCHVSKLFTNLSSTASHAEVYGASQLYFYEIDENSEDFHAKKPRQVLPYAVLTFSIIKPQDPQTMPLNEKPEEKNPVQRHDMPSRTDENTVSSPVPEDDFIENIPSAFNVSWTGQLLFKNKFIAFINLLSYSKKKQLLPDYVEQRLNICKKISQENLKSLYKIPIFRNGKPASTGVSKEFCSSGKFIYYEIQPVTQQREKYDKLLAYFIKDNTAAVLEYYGGSVHVYIMPTSQLTHDAGITDEKSPMILHALVHIKRLRHFPLYQEIQQLTSTDDTSSSEDNVRKQFQAIFGEKYKSKSQKRHSKIPSLLYKEILLNSGRDSDQISSSNVEDPKSRKRESPHTKHDDKSSPHKSLHRSESWSGHDEHDSRHTTRDSSSSYSSSNRYKWHKLQKRPSADNTSSKNTLNQEQLNTVTEDQFPRDQTSKAELEQQRSNKDSTTETTVNLKEVQRLIEQFKRQGTSLSAGLSTTRRTHTTTVDPRLHSRQPSNTDERRSERSVIPRDFSIPPPPIPPPPPPPLSPLVAVLSPPLPSTPGESLELSSTPEATPPPTVSTLSTFNLPVVPQSIRESPSSLLSPPAIKRKGINIPGLEDPGSAVFDLIKDTKMSSIRKTNRGIVDDSTSKSHPLSPLVRPIDNSKTVTSSQQVNPVAVKEKTTSSLSPQNSSSGISDKSPQSLGSRSIQVKPRPLTQAEKTASKAIKEVMNILERNAHVQDDSDTIPQDTHSLGNEINTTEDFRVKLKSILKISAKDTVENSVSMNNPTVDNVGVVDTMLSHRPAIKELHNDKEVPAVKVVSLDEYRKQKLQPSSSTSDKTSCFNTPERRPIQNCQSPATPELKSGLDLIDNLISKDKHRSQSIVKTASLRSSSIQSPSKDQDKSLVKKKTTYGKDEQSKKERKSLPKKRRIVTIKSKAPEQRSSGWDNLTSDISDDDLPDDKITSDISDIELPDDYMEADDGRTESRDNSRSSSKSCEVIPSSHHKPQYCHEEHERRFHDVCISQAWCDVEASESSRCYKKAFSSSRSSSPDERDRDRKRRRMDLNLNTYQKDEPLLCDNNSNDSGSAMSISPINSPVSFEYAAPEGTYRSVIASPTGRGNLEVTIPQDGCTIIGGISLPRTSPTEVHMDSPGTPETAVPAEDFLHANIGYWSSEFTTNRLMTQTKDDVPAYGELGYLETHDDRRYETANQASDIQCSYHQDNVSEEGWSTPPSRPYSPYSPTKLVDDDIDEYPVRTTEEDHIVRGEGYQLRRCRSIGESSGYESPSYLDLRRPFFGTTEDVIPSMYDKNITCTEDDYDDKYMDRYTLPDDVPGREQQYYTSQSPYEHIDSPRSVDSIDNYNHDRLLTEGRDSPVTPEYMDCKYSLDRKLDDNYDDYYYRSPSDDGDAFEQRISTYDGDLDPYHDEADYFSDEEPREAHYFDHDEDRYYSPGDQNPRGSYISKPMTEYERDYPSDDESLNTSDYYDHDSYQYLDDMAKDNISTTMFELDRVVCDGITSFPTQVLNLSNYYNANQAMVDNPADPVESSNSKGINQVSKNRDPRLNTRDPRLNKNDVTSSVNVANTEGTNQDGVPQTMDKVEKNVEKKAVKPHPRVPSYFYVYNPDNDNECESVKNYMLKTGALYLDVRDETKLKTIKGTVIRVLIRGKHKSALHKISNLSKLKCLRNVKFALFNTVEDVDKKTRAYTAIFQYGGVLIPDDFILKRVHPAYLEALLRFMREENVLHQKVFWVMNIRYQAYKKLVGSQRPLTWRDTFVLDLLRKYRNKGFVNIIHKEYVTEGLSLIQRYLDTAWKQQRDLLTTYRHFIMLSNMDKQRLEADWFRNRGMGFMDIKTFLLAFTGERKTRQLLSASIFTEDGDTRRPNTMDSSSRTVSTKTNRRDFKTSSSTMVSRSINYKADNNMKETRLEILSSINSVKDNLLNSMGGTATKDINDKDIAPLYSSKEGDTGSKDILDTRKEGNSSKERTTQFKGHVSSTQKESTWSRTVRSVNSKDHALQRGDSPRRRRDSPYQSRTASNVDHADRKHVKDRLSSSHPRLSTT